MSKKIKDLFKKNLFSIGGTLLVTLILTLFCRAMGYPIIIPLFLLFMGLHLIWIERADLKMFLHLGLLLTLILVTTYVIVDYTTIPYYYIPVAGIAMLAMLLFNDLHLAFLMSLTTSMFVSLILGGSLETFMVFLLGSLAGVYSVRDARTRGQLISGGVFVSIINVVVILLFNLNTQEILTKTFALEQLYPLAINGLVAAFLVAATLKIFESLFGALTNYSLLELSDFNQPLLKRMILEAPGTYHHSLVVSNLAEAAADEIGAKSLLTRVGAYYHDIGKMVKSEYFTENQLVGGNKHDSMEPSMSRLVILNHVKEGIELAKKYKLNQAIIDFIPQHHGTSLMYYFYQKALEEAEDGENIKEEDFRYPGPKPQTRETAITLLADSVEGATRALDEPTPTNIEETVQKIINNKFIDGQLDDCPLTLKEINRIANTFTRILTAMYHGRVKYPEMKNGNARSGKNLPKSKTSSAQKERNDSQHGHTDSQSPQDGQDSSRPDREDYSQDS